MSKKLFALPELDTRSVLDVVEENFKDLGLKTYAVRIIYIGEHTLTREEVTEHFGNTVRAVNSSYCEININGFLLVYDSYFVHILEGSEDTVHRQLRFLFKREQDWIKQKEEGDLGEKERIEEELQKKNGDAEQDFVKDETPTKKEWKMFRRLKMLMVYHSLKTLLFRSWRSLCARPPSLVGKLDVHAPPHAHTEQLRVCLAKIANLSTYVTADNNFTFEGLAVMDPKIESLPEVALLDFLLESPYVMDLRSVVHLHRRVDDYYFYSELVWPLANHFTPRHLYKLKVDDSFVEPLPVMPWESAAKDDGDDLEAEQQSISSDSD